MQAHEAAPERRLAAARLADEAERLARAHLERDAVDGLHAADLAPQDAGALDREVLGRRRAPRAAPPSLMPRAPGGSSPRAARASPRPAGSSGRGGRAPRAPRAPAAPPSTARRRAGSAARSCSPAAARAATAAGPGSSSGGAAAAGRGAGSSRAAPRCRGAARSANSSPFGPSSTIRPAYITQTRSATSATTPMSCVIRTIAEPKSRAQLADQRQDLRLDRDVERRRRLVGDQQVGVARERHRDHRALAHAARELVRVVVDAPLRARGCRRRRAARSRGACASRLRDLLVRPHLLGDLPADAVDRVERRHRVLEDHRDLASRGRRASALGIELQQVAALVDDLALEDRRSGRGSGA